MNEKRYIRFWKLVILASALISILSGCTHYYIEQEVRTYGGEINLFTSVVYGNEIDPTYNYRLVECWFDKELTDSVKCIRYNQAKELIEKIEHVENFKCE